MSEYPEGGPLFVKNIRQKFDLTAVGIPIKGSYRPMIPSQLIEALGAEDMDYMHELALRAGDPADDTVEVVDAGDGREVQSYGAEVLPRLVGIFRAVILACSVEWNLRDMHGEDPSAPVPVTDENLRHTADRVVLTLGQEVWAGCQEILGN